MGILGVLRIDMRSEQLSLSMVDVRDGVYPSPRDTPACLGRP